MQNVDLIRHVYSFFFVIELCRCYICVCEHISK